MNAPPEGGGGLSSAPGNSLAVTMAPYSASTSPGPGLARSQCHRSPATSPARKRVKLDLASVSSDPGNLKRKLFEWRTSRLRRKTTSYRDNMAELFFLKNGTNVTDSLPQFRKRPSQQFVEFLVTSMAPARVISEVQTAVNGQNSGLIVNSSLTLPSTPASSQPLPRPGPSYSPTVGVLSPVKIGEAQDTYSARHTASRPAPASSIPPPSAPVYSADQVTERIKQEGWVTRRVAELTRDGLWPARRLPQVAERPRPISAWDLVLEEMRWMATDFARERSWKKAAARVQSAACREHVIRKQEQEQAIQLELNSENHKKMIARKLAEKIETFWDDTECCYEYEMSKRHDIHIGKSLSQQSCIVSEHPPVKRKHPDFLPLTNNSYSVAPLTPESQHENGVSSDCESSISEQEAWELSNLVADRELSELDSDANTPLQALVSERYPGYEEDLRLRWEEELAASEDRETGGLSDWDTDSDCEAEDTEATVSLDSLLDTSDTTITGDSVSLTHRASVLSKSVIHPPAPLRLPSLDCDQEAALQWLVATQVNSLPGLLVSEAGRGQSRRVSLASLLAHLPSLDLPCPGPHLLVCPMASLTSWVRSLTRAAPSITVLAYSGGPGDRRRLREEIFLSSETPDLVITTYRTFFQDADWFLTRAWSLFIMTEVQNVISAGSSEQIRTLVNLKSTRRLLMMSGELRDTPIDLWNTLYLLFPMVYTKREESSQDKEVEVEGTPEYAETREKLLKIITGFSFQRPGSTNSLEGVNSGNVNETKLAVPLNSNKRKLYDDYLTQTLSQDHSARDLRVVCGAIQSLREICNELVEADSSPCPASLPDWCHLDRAHTRLWQNITDSYKPLENISLDQINLVFLSQEMTTTVLTSARLRSIKASKKLIQELSSSSSSPAPPVPRHKFQLGFESLTRGGWRSGDSLGARPGHVNLVKAANGQVYKMTVAEIAASETQSSSDQMEVDNPDTGLGAFHEDSLDTIASVNHWRCDGFPLYGQDLVKSLTITNTIKPLRSRFRGQGYVNCLNAREDSFARLSPEDPSHGDIPRDDWRYSTSALGLLCRVSNECLDQVLKNTRPNDDGLSDNKMKALQKVVYPGYKQGKKIVVVTGLSSLEPAIANVCNKSGIRYCAIRPGDSLSRQVASVSAWRLDPRLTVLVLAGLDSSSSSLDLSSADLLVTVDTGPGHWEPRLECPLVRLVASGTVEEGLTRVETVRKILQDIKSKADNVMLSKQTVTDILNPTPDNGYTKKKEKGLSESEETMWNLFSTCLGSSSDHVQSLLDLAELGTIGEVGEVGEDLDEETVELLQWLQDKDPVQRYGMRLLRDHVEIRLGLSKLGPEPESVEDSKMDWETKQADKMRQQEEEETGEMITYSRELVDRQWRSGDGTVSSVWRPRGQLHVPDTVAPETTFSGYSKQIIPESQLPPVHVKKEKKAGPAPFDTRVICAPMSPPTLSGQMSPSNMSSDVTKTKIKREDLPSSAPPKSLFDRPRPMKMVPRRPMGGLQPSPFQSSHLVPGSGPASGSSFQPLRPLDAGPEWTIQEDWALHQAVLSLQELSLATVSSGGHSGHIINWDLVSDMVNAVSWCYRPAKQCRARWEASLVPREEGRITMENTPKKLKKDKKLGVNKVDKKAALLPSANAMKTAALYRNDNNNAISTTFSSRFETIKAIANKRTPTTTPLLVNPTLRNPKHAAVLAESGVDYESPVSPIQVAANRAERIQASKRTAQLAAVGSGQQLGAAAVSGTATAGSGTVTVVGGQPQLPQSPVPAQIRTGSGSASVSLPSQPAQAVVVGISQPLQQAVIQNSGTVTRPVQQTVTALSVQDLLKNVSASSASVNLSSAGPGAAQRQLSSGQIIVSQAGRAVAGPGGTVQVTNQRLTPQQLQLLKQQAMNKKAQEQQQLKQRLASVSSATATVATAGAVTTTLATAGKLTVTGAVPASIGRGQMINRQTIRNITDPEFKALLAKQGGAVKVGQGGVVQVSANSMTAAQLQQLGIQVATSSNSGTGGTLVKTVSAPAQGTSKAVTIAGVPGVNLPTGQLKAVPTGRGTAVKGSPQQMQQLQIQQQLKLLQQKGGLQGQRVALSTGGKGVPTQLIVPGGNKGLPTAVTVQQLQQIVKGAGLAGGQGQVIQGQQILSHVVKPGGQTVQARVIPVSGGAARGQQTIQVVTATPQRQGAPNVTINQMGRAPGAGELTAGNNIKIQVPQGASHQQILSQISTALAGAGNGQNVSVAVRTPAGSSATVLQPAAVVQQSVATSQQQQRQQPQQQNMVNLQLSVANPVQQQSSVQPQTQIQQQSAPGTPAPATKTTQQQPQQQQSKNTDV